MSSYYGQMLCLIILGVLFLNKHMMWEYYYHYFLYVEIEVQGNSIIYPRSYGKRRVSVESKYPSRFHLAI